MKSTTLAILVSIFFFNSAIAADAKSSVNDAESSDDEVEMVPNKDGSASTSISDVADFCFLAGTPPSDVKYTVIKRLKVGKGTYGGVKDILPKLAAHAKKVGADAIMNYTGSQRFGLLPWRMVRPVVRGVAIKLSDQNKMDCTAIGGRTLKEIFAADKAPSE